MTTTGTTNNLTVYEQACFHSIDDLFHTAYIVLVDADAAEKLVTEICVAGVQKYDHLEDEAETRFRLTSDLYHHLKRRLWFCTPNKSALPEHLHAMSKWERLALAMRFSSGLSAADSVRICGCTEADFTQIISSAARKIPFVK